MGRFKTNALISPEFIMMLKNKITLLFLFAGLTVCAQPLASLNDAERGSERTLRYSPDGEDFVIVNGKKKFNRALYGTHTGFRVETSDVPELALYLPRMGGNLSFGIESNGRSLQLNNAKQIESRYRPGSRIYTITDPLLGGGELILTVLAMSDADGMILRFETKDLPADVSLSWRFGGAADKRFSREGDLGVDPVDCFELKPEYCVNNQYKIARNTFHLTFGKNGERELCGTFPSKAKLNLAKDLPVLDGVLKLTGTDTFYMAIQTPETKKMMDYSLLEACFDQSEKARKELASQVKINTPDPYFNTLGGALAVAADGIWSGEVWLHGAVGWRMPLSGWRAAYTGDALGWHDRARKHFDAYAASQVIDVLPVFSHPTQDPEMNLARAEKRWGTQMYSNGYICRNPWENNKMHHYDMNLCYIDELLWHFNWTGDVDYARRMWPVLQRHLAWEKRNFDPDNDGLYDAYCCIWASDALQYNSGAVTHSSAYNYRANKMAAKIALLIGEDPEPYTVEADKILNALNIRLWLPAKGYWAEFQDFMGHKKIHESTGIWSVYHALDSEIHDPFQAYQATRYIDTEIPHIPVVAKGLKDEGYATISTTNWLPYSWSINNVAFAEVMHTSLAYWQAGRNEEAFNLLKSSILDGMYLGSSPGNFGQVSFYDAARGECYRDFGDPVGVASRALIQGLFGVIPDAMNGSLLIRPGFPDKWDYASVATSDLAFDFKREARTDKYDIQLNFEKQLSLNLQVRAQSDRITSLKVNGEDAGWTLEEMATGYPIVKIEASPTSRYQIELVWGGEPLKSPVYISEGAKGDKWTLKDARLMQFNDPQQVLKSGKVDNHELTGILNGEVGHRTLFVFLKQGEMEWWQPVHIEIDQPITAKISSPDSSELEIELTNASDQDITGVLKVNPGTNEWSLPVNLKAKATSGKIVIPSSVSDFGTNKIRLETDTQCIYETALINWNIPLADREQYEPVNMDQAFNAPVTQLFKNEYLTPRSPFTTLQVPKQGIGEWCHPKTMADIDDSGVRRQVNNNLFMTTIGIPFRSVANGNNIAFTTLWDNYPDKLSIPLTGKTKHAYLLMAGTTNHMQCHFVNGVIKVHYTDGTNEVLNLVNPENWCPIEQDFFVDGKAFKLDAPRPYRLHLKSGLLSRNLEKDLNIKGVYGRSIDGGAGILVDIPLDATKELKSLELETMANEVVIGIMGITLQK